MNATKGESKGGELWDLARLYTKLGFIAFGGPAAHVAMMRQEVVERRKWMSDQEFLDLNGATNRLTLLPTPQSHPRPSRTARSEGRGQEEEPTNRTPTNGGHAEEEPYHR